MEFSEFVRTVADHTQLSREEAADLSRAVLEALGQRISAGELRQLGVELPDELRGTPRKPTKNGHGQKFGLVELIQRVSKHTGLNSTESFNGIVAVLSTLSDAVSPKQFDDVLAQLPGDVTALVRSPS
jgi:uncharacterized protein (DUF2267 family)